MRVQISTLVRPKILAHAGASERPVTVSTHTRHTGNLKLAIELCRIP